MSKPRRDTDKIRGTIDLVPSRVVEPACVPRKLRDPNQGFSATALYRQG